MRADGSTGAAARGGARRHLRVASGSRLAAPLLVVIIAFSLQSGSALAILVIADVGVVQALWLRTAIAAALLALARPRSLRLPPRGERWPLAGLTVALFAMNLSFYGAIANAPLGVVVAIEFLGPLCVAIAGSRRPLDFLWVALAGGGVVLLAGPTGSVSALGMALSVLAGASWAAYLVLGKRAVRSSAPLQVTTWMFVGSTILISPLLAVSGLALVGHGGALALGAAVAVLSSAFPYVVELLALRLVRAATYSVLLSLEPAVAALTGFLIAGQRLSALELAGIGAVMVAAAGATRRGDSTEANVPPAPD